MRKPIILVLTACLLLIASTSSQAQFSPYFPYGIFEDGNMWSSRPTLQNDLAIIKSRGITDLLFTNSTPNVDVYDTNGMSVVAAPMRQLNSEWWLNNSPAAETLDAAKAVAIPIINSFANHPSIRAYNLADDAFNFSTNKISLMTQAFNQLDTQRSAGVMMPTNASFLAANPPMDLFYSYPATITSAACDFNSKSYMGQYTNNYAQQLELRRDTLGLAERDIPFWAVLQTHGISTATDPNSRRINDLRTPTVEELRIQNWDALAEGVRGIYWFIYKTQQFWHGLEDNPALFNEVTDLTARVKPLTQTLLNLENYEQQLFTVASADMLPFANQPLVRTLISKEGNHWYIVVVNHSCAPQMLTVDSFYTGSSLRDAETGAVYTLGQGIPFRAGDGKLLEVVDGVQAPPIVPSPNLVTNSSFEQGDEFAVTDWTLTSSITHDATIAHTGASSLKLTGPLAFGYLNVPQMDATLKPNTKYAVSFWVRTENVGDADGIAMQYVHMAPSIGFQLTPLKSRWVNQTSDWQQVFFEFYTFAEVTQSRFDLMYALPAGGVVWVDDIMICEGNIDCIGALPAPPDSTSQVASDWAIQTPDTLSQDVGQNPLSTKLWGRSGL